MKYLGKIILGFLSLSLIFGGPGVPSPLLPALAQEASPDMPPDTVTLDMPGAVPPEGATGDTLDPTADSYYEPGTHPESPEFKKAAEATDETYKTEDTATVYKGEAASITDEDIVAEAGEETISMDLRGIEITEFFKVLSRKLGINIIPTNKVTGRVSLFLNNIKYKDALDIVVLSQGLAYEKRGDSIIMLMTAAEYEALYGKKFNDKKEMKMLKLDYGQPKLVFNALSSLKSSVGNVIVDEATGTILIIDTPEKIKEMMLVAKDLDKPLTTEIFELQYAKVTDVKENLTSIVSKGTGSVLTDERSNTVIVTDLPGNMKKVKQAITMLDQETKEVFILAEILEISLRDRLRSGIDWDVIMSNNFYDWTLAGTFSSALTAALSGTFTSDNPFNMNMDFLTTLADTKVLSRPRIAVVNNEEAVIMVGDREAYVTGTTSQSGESTITSDTVEFVDVGVKLTVVPTINRDGFITMKIKPEVSTVLRTLTTGDPDEPRSQIPIVSTSEAETTVKVKDGTTILIAGLRRNEDTKDVDGLPYLSRIPFMDIFFSRKDHDQHQTEIVIFITPFIMRGEQMRGWDKEDMKKYPSHTWPENRDYGEKPVLRTGPFKESD
ncbi:MAG: type II secretion system protein GspD [Candidatus Omnitrophica bacterium]|nr:type II secretion system protein GspD [Candidatus Omnitrophota bacterium]